MKKTILFLLSTCLLTSCGTQTYDSTQQQSTNTSSEQVTNQVEEIYQAYKANGGTLSYEEWLATIKGEKGDKGDKGDQGEKGENGNDGTDGKNGSSILAGNGTPSSSTGSDGDSYIDTSTWDYYIKSNGTWSKIGNIKGVAGENGANGEDGNNGYTPYVENGEWYINGQSTGIKATNGIELRLNGNNVEWKSDDSNEWKVLFSLDLLKGNDGNSAYEIYKKLCGYDGSEEEWLSDLISGKLAYKDPGNIDYVPDINIRTTIGETAYLPEKILVYYSNGTNIETNVDWTFDTYTCTYLGYKTIVGFISGYNEKVKCNIRTVNYSYSDSYIDGYINGILENDEVTIAIYNDDFYTEVNADSNGYYTSGTLPSGQYFVKPSATNYDACTPVSVELEEYDNEVQNKYKNISHQNFTLSAIREGTSYYYLWGMTSEGVTYETTNKEDEVATDLLDEVETQTTTNEAIKPLFKILSKKQENYSLSDKGSASYLRQKYNAFLDDRYCRWSNETVSRFLTVFSTLPEAVIPSTPSVWSLTTNEIDNDITINHRSGYDEITLGLSTLKYSTPRNVDVKGKQVEYFSNRLYNALLRFVTDNGNNESVCETILNTNFLSSFKIPDYKELTKGITNENEDSFQEFLPEEKIQIITMFEEMPKGLHKIKELKYLVRRKNGTVNPIYPSAAAVTWTKAPTPYIEFMESTFINKAGYYDTKRLIIHEKMHMYYEYYFSDELKKQWCDIGGWYEDEADPDGWSTTKTTEFVSAYAHQHNPDEDMAESAATYIINPNLLKTRAIEKYEFIRDYIANGEGYVAQVRPDLTFEVYNLCPDYVYPGKIMNTTVVVTGDDYEDKDVQITFDLYDDGSFSGASSLYFRIEPGNGKDWGLQYYDFGGSPIDSSGLKLRAQRTISKYSQKGYWFTDQITLSDNVGNERYQGIHDFNMKIFIMNPLEDLEPPTFDKDSLKISVAPSNSTEHPNEQILTIEMNVHDNVKIAYGEIRLNVLKSNKYSKDYYLGTIDENTGYVKTEIIIPDYYSTATYEIESIVLWDLATNIATFNLNHEEYKDVVRSIDIVTANPDDEAPTLDVNDIKISAVPSNPTNPNGETYVTIKIKAKDSISGLQIGYLRLIDPVGNIHGDWIYFGWGTGSYYGPTEEAEYTIKRTLPVGSAPGIWGIYEISLTDFANNTRAYNFVEIIHFTVNG